MITRASLRPRRKKVHTQTERERKRGGGEREREMVSFADVTWAWLFPDASHLFSPPSAQQAAMQRWLAVTQGKPEKLVWTHRTAHPSGLYRSIAVFLSLHPQHGLSPPSRVVGACVRAIVQVSCSDDHTLFLWEPASSKKPLIRMTGHQVPAPWPLTGHGHLVLKQCLNTCPLLFPLPTATSQHHFVLS
jgi:hypothetical protein